MYHFMYKLFTFPYIYPLKAKTGRLLKVVKKFRSNMLYYMMLILYKTKQWYEGVRVL